MKGETKLLKSRSVNGVYGEESIGQQLDSIKKKLDEEIIAKQNTIEWQEDEIRRLHLLAEEKNLQLNQNNEKLTECARNNEGNRQLINKLLNDIERLQQDIEWYKRTYEKRSLLGTLKEKVFKRKRQ